jgi:hypothetical protein
MGLNKNWVNWKCSKCGTRFKAWFLTGEVADTWQKDTEGKDCEWLTGHPCFDGSAAKELQRLGINYTGPDAR